MTFICGNCAHEYASFVDVLGCFLKHIAAGEYVRDWVEVTTEMVREKK